LRKIRGVVDVSLFGKRFKGEKYDLREFVQPDTLMVRELASKLKTPEECYRWVVEEVDYPYRPSWPSWTMVFSDFHSLFRHPPRPRLSFNFLDYWKFPSETIRDRVGDCEDSSFLLASLLRSLEKNVYAVLGYIEVDGRRYGHAWVECREDGCRVLETTYDEVPPTIPTCEQLYDRVYFPEMKFNEREVQAVRRAKPKDLKFWRLKPLRKPKKLRKAVGCRSRGKTEMLLPTYP